MTFSLRCCGNFILAATVWAYAHSPFVLRNTFLVKLEYIEILNDMQVCVMLHFSICVGAHELNLVSNPNTNGSYCPGRITFICNGTNVANGLQWLINGNVNNTFILEPGDTKFPRTVSVTNDITIMVISASPVENSLGINVLSVLSVESLYPILDDAISCRTLSGSSSPFVVRAKGNVKIHTMW